MIRTTALVLLALLILAVGWIALMTIVPIGRDTLTSQAIAGHQP